MAKITPTSTDLENNGKWTEYYGVKVLIARSNNMKYKKAFRRLTKPYKRTGIDKLSDEQADVVLASSIAEGILLDWKGYTNENGEEVDYSVGKLGRYC